MTRNGWQDYVVAVYDIELLQSDRLAELCFPEIPTLLRWEQRKSTAMELGSASMDEQIFYLEAKLNEVLSDAKVRM